ncbi:hypothetical protein D3C80_2047820 [compost metagenome]
MIYTVQLLDAFNADDPCSRTTNDCAHAGKVIRKIDNFRLFRCIFDNGCTFC